MRSGQKPGGVCVLRYLTIIFEGNGLEPIQKTPPNPRNHISTGFGKIEMWSWRFLAFFGLKRRWKMLILCIVQRFQSNLFWRQFTWYKRPKHWGKDIMGKNKASFVNESRIWLSIVAFQHTMVIKGKGKKMFFTSFWYYNNVEHW